MSARRLTIGEINALDRDAFVERLGSVFENSPWIAATAWPLRPFSSRQALHRAICDVADRASPAQQLALIQAHPDLVGQAAVAGTLTRTSSAEQAAAGLDLYRLSKEERAAFATNNHGYRERFGFPFVICARENKKATILAGFAARLEHDREQEIGIALAEIAKIAHYRLVDLVAEG